MRGADGRQQRTQVAFIAAVGGRGREDEDKAPGGAAVSWPAVTGWFG